MILQPRQTGIGACISRDPKAHNSEASRMLERSCALGLILRLDKAAHGIKTSSVLLLVRQLGAVEIVSIQSGFEAPCEKPKQEVRKTILGHSPPKALIPRIQMQQICIFKGSVPTSQLAQVNDMNVNAPPAIG